MIDDKVTTPKTLPLEGLGFVVLTVTDIAVICELKKMYSVGKLTPLSQAKQVTPTLQIFVFPYGRMLSTRCEGHL